MLDLIEEKGTGIISILDDICIAPGNKDLNLARSLSDKVKNPRFEASHLQVGNGHFLIHHFTGSVEYDTSGFITKNKDELPREAKELMMSSSKPFVQGLTKLLGSLITEEVPSGSRRRGKKKMRTVGGQFVIQLQKLRDRVDNTSSHYIRCIKPNQELVPDDFNPTLVSQQLRSLGILEAVRLSRTGFPQRFTHKLFLHRYSITVPGKMKGVMANKRGSCKMLVDLVSKKLWIDNHGDPGMPKSEQM